MTETGETLGSYLLEDALGGTRTVFRARHIESGDVVCVKLLPEHLRLDAINRGRRKRELLATRQVRHGGIGRPLDFVDAGGRLFLVMEYVEGAPLSMALFGGAVLRPSRALRVVRGAAEAVAAAHAAHATHGCLEPDKVLLDVSGNIRVVGFGFRDEDALKNPGPDLPAEVDLCTAPERWSGAFETPEADVWALGALLYRCLSGVFPFEAETRAELAHKVQTSDVVPPRFEAGIVEKPAIEAVVLRALSRDPTLRYPDAAVLARALVELEGMLPPEADTPEEPAFVDDADVQPLTLDDPPPPPPDEDALAALADLEDAIQSHEAFVDPLVGLLSGPAASPAALHAPIGDEESGPTDEHTRFDRSPNDATTVEAPSLDGTTVERSVLEMPSLALPSLEGGTVGAPGFGGPSLDGPSLDGPSLEPPPAPPALEMVGFDGPDFEETTLDPPPAPPSEPPSFDGPVVEEMPPVPPVPSSLALLEGDASTSADPFAEDIDVEAIEEEPLPASLPAPGVDAAAEGETEIADADVESSSEAPPPSTGPGGPPVPPPAEERAVVKPLPMVVEEPEPRSRVLAIAAVGLLLIAGAFFAFDPLGLRASAKDAKPTEALAAAAPSPAADAPTKAADAGSDTDGGTPTPSDEAPSADEAAAAVAANEGMNAAEAGQEADEKAEPEAGAETWADLPPKEAWAAADKALEKLLEERGILWKDDRQLDRLRLKSRRDGKAGRYAEATRTAEEAIQLARKLEIDDKVVKRKLARFVQRRKQVRDDDVAKRARVLETSARKRLKDGELEEANTLLNTGLKLMYRPE